MILNVYSAFDEKSMMFQGPFYLPQDGQAMRGFGDAVNGGKGVIAQHPEDFRLYKLGRFDDEKGKFENLDVPELLCTGIQFVAPSVQAPNFVSKEKSNGNNNDSN